MSFSKRDAAASDRAEIPCLCRQAINSTAIRKHRASATLPVITTLGSREMKLFPQQIKQRNSRIHCEAMALPVNLQSERHSIRGRSCGRSSIKNLGFVSNPNNKPTSQRPYSSKKLSAIDLHSCSSSVTGYSLAPQLSPERNQS
jgi:hypothetical protein